MNNRFTSELIEVFRLASSHDELMNLFVGLLTPKELDEISRRLQIAKMLKEGKSQRYIAKKLNVGIATVTRGSKEIANGRFKNL
jgi:TrpR family trp operon transcriptional repressor